MGTDEKARREAKRLVRIFKDLEALGAREKKFRTTRTMMPTEVKRPFRGRKKER